jgi:hypothetical protein
MYGRLDNSELVEQCTPGEARGALRQYPSDLLDAYEVSTRINSVKNGSPDLIGPVERVAATRIVDDARRVIVGESRGTLMVASPLKRA